MTDDVLHSDGVEKHHQRGFLTARRLVVDRRDEENYGPSPLQGHLSEQGNAEHYSANADPSGFGRLHDGGNGALSTAPSGFFSLGFRRRRIFGFRKEIMVLRWAMY